MKEFYVTYTKVTNRQGDTTIIDCNNEVKLTDTYSTTHSQMRRNALKSEGAPELGHIVHALKKI